MSILVIGPSSSGKSTYLKNINAKKIYFGYQLLNKTEIPESGYIHYNLLHFPLTLQKQNVLIPADWDLMKESILARQHASHKSFSVAFSYAQSKFSRIDV